jgi:hypothetical protein
MGSISIEDMIQVLDMEVVYEGNPFPLTLKPAISIDQVCNLRAFLITLPLNGCR